MIPFTKLGDLTLLTSGNVAAFATAVEGTWYDALTYTINATDFKKNVVIAAVPYTHDGSTAAASALYLNVRIYDNTDSVELASGTLNWFNATGYFDHSLVLYVGELVKKDHEIKIQVKWGGYGTHSVSNIGLGDYEIWTDI